MSSPCLEAQWARFRSRPLVTDPFETLNLRHQVKKKNITKPCSGPRFHYYPDHTMMGLLSFCLDGSWSAREVVKKTQPKHKKIKAWLPFAARQPFDVNCTYICVCLCILSPVVGVGLSLFSPFSIYITIHRRDLVQDNYIVHLDLNRHTKISLSQHFSHFSLRCSKYLWAVFFPLLNLPPY